MVEPLESPRVASDLYLAREEEVSLLRPIMTGDVFAGVDIPGVEELTGDDEKLAVVVAHPCSMREGPRLKPRLQVARVVSCPVIDLGAWHKAHYDKMPLPDLTAIIDLDEFVGEDAAEALQTRRQETFRAALLEYRGRVDAALLDLDKRIACMSEEGVALLHQRMSHNDTRYAPAVDDLVEVCAPVFHEAELAERWNEDLIAPTILDDRDLLTAELAKIAEVFDEELGRQRVPPGKPTGRFTLRGDLQLAKKRPNARRQILSILAARLQAQSKVG